MRVNNKRNESHHLPCLSGLSQAPLIGDANERLTPISAHSLTQHHHPLPHPHHPNLHHHQSPNRISLNQTQQQHKSICSTPQMPNFCVASNSNKNASSIFFPALPPKTNLNKSHLNLESSVCFSASNNNHDSRKSIDLNMNREDERNREDPTASFGQDENYHLYHEPLDPDEPIASESTRRPTPIVNMVLSHNSNNQQAPPPPSTPRCVGVPLKDWPSQPLPPRPSSQSQMTNQRSPNFINQDERNGNSNNHDRTSASNVPPPFSDRAASFRNDIADDVYFRYVTLKSAERSTNRSRSYHGPKLNGATSHSRDDQSPHNNESLNRNLNSSSVSDIPPTSPAISTPTTIPFRDHCIRELIETESNYVHALEMMITCFAKPLEILLKRDENQLIFGHIRYFHHIHTVFQTDLVKTAFKLFNKDLPLLPSSPRNNAEQQQVTSSNPATPMLAGKDSTFSNASPLSSPTAKVDVPGNRSPKISMCFLNMKDKFLKYGEYCATLSKAQALLDELTSRNEAIAAQLDRCQQDANEGKFKLRDLLSLPMQRILKYHLLLAQLIKNSSSANDDYQGLKRAHEAMVDLGQYINEVKRDTEATQIMNEIEQSIVGLNMPPNTRLIDYGRLVTDGFIRIKAPQESKAKSTHELTKIKLPHDTKVKQKRYVFVFDKVILMCKLNGVRRYQYKEALVLSEYELETTPATPSDTFGKHSIKDKWGYSFNLNRACDKTTYSFYAKTIEMKNKWVSAIQRAMDNTRPGACRNNAAAGHEFLMHTFDKASSCDHCGKLLLGLYYQGYRCRICFTSVHKKCLASVRTCGPALPPKMGAATLSHSNHRSKFNEPPSPSVQSNHSDTGHSVFTHFPSPNSSSTQCMDELSKNEYNNLGKGRMEAITSSSFRENGARAPQVNQRPVSSMINVSLQNSTNHLIQQKRLLRSSTSSPSISRQPSSKARAIQNFDGDESCGEMKIVCGDVILLSPCNETIPHHQLTQAGPDVMDGSMSKLSIGNPQANMLRDTATWLSGRNLRTGREGRFPSLVVETFIEHNESDERLTQRSPVEGEHRPAADLEPHNSYVNFPLSDQPWFNDRMDRDRAQTLLEELPHGTFLVRVSPKHHNSYVISLKYQTKVMHMRIYVSKDNQLYLSQNRYFNSIVELVSWYQENSLVESFNMLDARLTFPYKHR